MDPVFHVLWLHVLSLAIALADRVTDLLFGHTFSGGSRRERLLSRRRFDRSGHLVEVFRSVAFLDPTTRPDLIHHVFRHVEYLDPRAILQREDVCLSHVDEAHAYFAVADERGADLYDTRRFPFFPWSLRRLCSRFILLPVSAFHRLAEEAGDPAVDLCFLAMTPRSGSTLITQIAHSCPNTRALGEPFSLVGICQMFLEGACDREQLRQLLRSSVRLQAKREPGSDCRRVFVKLHPSMNPHLDLLAELFPRARLVYCTRGLTDSLVSARRVVSTARVGLFGSLGIFWRRFLSQIHAPLEGDRDLWLRKRLNPIWQNVSDDEALFLWHAASLACYFQFRDLFHGVVFYEELVSEPEAAVGRLFKAMSLADADVARHVPAGISVLDRDSQNGLFRAADSAAVDAAARSMMATLCLAFQLPVSCDQDWRRLRETMCGGGGQGGGGAINKK